MAICDPRTHLQSPKSLFSRFQSSIILFVYLLPFATPISFNFSEFGPNTQNITYQGDAFPSNRVIQLTKNQRDVPLNSSVGRSIYAHPVHLWDSATGSVTDFMTHFSFIINALDASNYGDGLAFFLVPSGSDLPTESSGGNLGLFSGNSTSNSSQNNIVAVEFDSFKNGWDPSDNHVGINVNSILSVANVTWKSSIKNGSTANAWVSYNASTKNLSVFLTYAQNPIFGGNSSLWYVVDLKEILPEWIDVGFSAATGKFVEIHNILSWEFTSSLEIGVGGKKQKKIGLVVGLPVGVSVLICSLGLVWFVMFIKKRRGRIEEDLVFDVSMNDEFEKGTGPKRFSYKELALATNNFTEDGKLGEGGFGGVYKGFFSQLNMNVAVKRVSRGSQQGKKEYASEVKIISRLRHRNLVQLIGWCHERGELLLVYELMPNGSLDSHLFCGKTLLTWGVRYKIAHGLATALLYLHEEWEQCVVHRDIKSSNVMLDSGFNAKLGDFGLARLVDHELGSQTTVLAGTMGYLAPECVTTGKASKESDVYSFGIVALEIACGRRPVELRAEPIKVRMVEWVWDLYGRGRLLEAADQRLSMEFEEKQMECLMVVGLWCAHPDFNFRPSIKQVINVLNFEAPLPSLPSQMPVPMYFAPPMNMCRFSYASSGVVTNSERDPSRCSCSSCTTYSSKWNVSTGSPSTALLK
ncbi:L-type lectin-domain containing receptor kinase IX.1-like [Magnolia sinica]|uniref:L-type lectin-domain containing receptor kinase IX.1-like n=1 Tax=Magnolia sinica TaxID=86752 RepID=UPI00265A0E00|nr:L-type lectin-domain containing receptor kinase IX.1-like [Magnolia sinica]